MLVAFFVSLQINYAQASGDTTGYSHPAVKANAEILSQIDNYIIELEQAMSLFEPGSKADMTITSRETIWNAGLRHRVLSRTFFYLTENGLDPVEESHGEVEDASIDAVEIRRMAGWDPDHPYPLPLGMGRNAKHFGSVRCSISPSDPQAWSRRVEEAILLWRFPSGESLSEIDQRAKLIEISSPHPEIVRLQIDDTSDPELAPLVGTVIDVDLEHGSLIRRIELPRENGKDVLEVIQFERSAPDQHWIPVETRSTYPLSDGRLLMVNHTVISYEGNVTIPDDDLTVQFPEGARVDDMGGAIHIWGQGKPEASFSTHEVFYKYVMQQARDFQSTQDQAKSFDPSRSAQTLVIVLNIVLIAILFILFAIRNLLPKERSALK